MELPTSRNEPPKPRRRSNTLNHLFKEVVVVIRTALMVIVAMEAAVLVDGLFVMMIALEGVEVNHSDPANHQRMMRKR